MTSYKKLVRDKIPEIIEANGDKAVWHIAGDQEFKENLSAKLHEEVAEFLDNVTLEEAADIMEVVLAMCKENNLDITELDEVRKQKLLKRGGFEKKIILETTY